MSEPQHPAYGVVRPVTDFASVVLCRNPGMMTLDGTNTWILRAPGHKDCVVVDPGPKGKKKHVKNVVAQGNVVLGLITHRHPDHTGAIKLFRELTGAPVRARVEKYTRDGSPLQDREVIEAAGLKITVLHTPGHTGDSVSFLVEHNGRKAMLTGDTILGGGTTVLDPKDGTLRDYMNSLNRIIVEGDDCVLLPGHGPDHAEVIPLARHYKAHREERVDQVRAALAELGVSAAEAKPKKVVKKVYTDIDKKLWPAATMSVKTQLAYLAEQ